MDFTFPQIAAAIFLFCFLSGCATTTPPEGFYQGETPYTMETDTMQIQKIANKNSSITLPR